MRKKRQIHCTKCNNAITVAKKGKHRYFICPSCGVIATNPIPLIPLATAIGSAVLPSIIEKVSNKVSPTQTQKPDEQPPVVHRSYGSRLLNLIRAEKELLNVR